MKYSYNRLLNIKDQNLIDQGGDFGLREAEVEEAVNFYRRLLEIFCQHEDVSIRELLINKDDFKDADTIYEALYNSLETLVNHKYNRAIRSYEQRTEFFLFGLFYIFIVMTDLDWLDGCNKKREDYEMYWSAEKFKLDLHERISLLLQWQFHTVEIHHVFRELQEYIAEQPNETPRSIMDEEHYIRSLVRHFIPHVGDIDMRNHIFPFVLEELRELEPGSKEWKRYEDLCEIILNFCFKPQINKIYSQVRTLDNYERRDFIIPINHQIGIYNSLFHEYNCKNIVVEVKNMSTNFTKSIINQVRAYLSKPTIGRFGICLIRNKENAQNLEIAVLKAYADSGMLIMILDDQDLVEMVYYKIIFGRIDRFLQKKKVEFELNY